MFSLQRKIPFKPVSLDRGFFSMKLFEEAYTVGTQNLEKVPLISFFSETVPLMFRSGILQPEAVGGGEHRGYVEP
jgi:hypothetical protein